MKRYTLQERIEIHYKNGENLAETVRKTRTFLGRPELPCRTAIKKLVEKFELLRQVSDVKNKARVCRSRTAENIAAIAEIVEENLGLSIPPRSLELGLPQTSLHRILVNIDLNNVYSQQDIATCHTSNETIDLLREKFLDRIISRRGDHNWPPRSCDLTPCNFFFWKIGKPFIKDNPRMVKTGN